MVIGHAVGTAVIGNIASLSVAAIGVPQAAHATQGLGVARSGVAVVVCNTLYTLVPLSVTPGAVGAVGVVEAP